MADHDPVDRLDNLLVDHIDWGNDMLVNLFPLWKEKILCDTTIMCRNDESLQAHSILLAAASPSLYSFFRNSDQGTYIFRCTSVPLSIWKNCVTFIYTGRLDIGKEELVPTYNLANKLAMFNFSKQLATQLKNHGLVRGGMMKTQEEVEEELRLSLKRKNDKGRTDQLLYGVKEEETEDSKLDDTMETDAMETDASDNSVAKEIPEAGSPSNDSNNMVGSPPSAALDVLPRADSNESSTNDHDTSVPDSEIDDIILSSTEDASSGLGLDNRYECPHCFMNFKRLSALKKHLRCCRTAKKLGMLPDAEGPFMGNLVVDKGKSRAKTSSPRNPYTQIKHMYRKLDDGQFECAVCQNPCKTYQGIYMHIKVKHLGVKPNRPSKSRVVESTAADKTGAGESDVLSDLPSEAKQHCIVKAKHLGVKSNKPSKSRVVESTVSDKTDAGESDVLSDLPSEAKQHCIVNIHSYYKIRCRTCGKLFKNKPAFIMHVKMHHSSSKKFSTQVLINPSPLFLSTTPVSPRVPLAETNHPASSFSLSPISSTPLMISVPSHIPSASALSMPSAPVLTLSRGSSNLTSTIISPVLVPTAVSSISSISTLGTSLSPDGTGAIDGTVRGMSGTIDGTAGGRSPMDGITGGVGPIDGSAGGIGPTDGSSRGLSPIDGGTGVYHPQDGSASLFGVTGGLADKDKDNYQCHICDRTFFKKVNLGSHMRIHDPEYHTKSIRKKKKQ